MPQLGDPTNTIYNRTTHPSGHEPDRPSVPHRCGEDREERGRREVDVVILVLVERHYDVEDFPRKYIKRERRCRYRLGRIVRVGIVIFLNQSASCG